MPPTRTHEGDYRVADAAQLPFDDASFAVVTAFMSLQDVDDLGAAANEIARVLAPGGHACVAVLHPINSGGSFEEHRPDAPFVIRDPYLETRRYADVVERDGLRMTFSSYHRPLQDYVGALTAGGLLVEQILEIPDDTVPLGTRWQRVPLFLHLRAVKSP